MNYRILVVDDDEVLCSNIKEYFEEKNCIVDIAQNGEEGLSLIAETDPDLILLDIMMPNKSGIAVIKELESKPDIMKKIVLMTNAEDTGLLSIAVEKGIKHYFVKSNMSLEAVYNIAMSSG